MAPTNSILIFDGSRWMSRSDVGSAAPLLFDSRGDLWMGGGSTGLRVMWGGEDYPVVDGGQWISSTLYRASYLVTPIVPKGRYAVSAGNAAGQDGMLVASDSGYAFDVDYAGAVPDGTPPTRPVVTAANDGSLSTISISWNSSDPESGIDQFKYASGAAPGAQDVVNWTYVPKTTTSVILNGLLLDAGKTYYVTVAARNTSGLWSENGVSNPVVAGTPTVVHRCVYLPIIIR